MWSFTDCILVTLSVDDDEEWWVKCCIFSVSMPIFIRAKYVLWSLNNLSLVLDLMSRCRRVFCSRTSTAPCWTGPVSAPRLRRSPRVNLSLSYSGQISYYSTTSLGITIGKGRTSSKYNRCLRVDYALCYAYLWKWSWANVILIIGLTQWLIIIITIIRQFIERRNVVKVISRALNTWNYNRIIETGLMIIKV